MIKKLRLFELGFIPRYKKNIFFLILISTTFSCQENIVKETTPWVEVRLESGKASIYKNGEPYKIIGGSGFEQMEKLAEYGGNSIRTWNTDNAAKILDEAEENGLSVILGIGIGKEYWGDDFNYYNLKAVDRKIDEIIKTVELHKDHPALLMWGVGNEVSLFGGNRFIVYYTINKIAKRIKSVDPNHPTMTAVNISMSDHKYAIANVLLKDIDLLGFNAFERLPMAQDKVHGFLGWNKPYIYSEWGPTGHWEANYTDWGAAIEKSTTDKAKMIRNWWGIINNGDDLMIGSWAFYWGFKYEITHTWFSLFSEEGHESESVNFLKNAWTGVETKNWAPQIEALIINNFRDIDNIYLETDSVFTAQVYAKDPENDKMSYRWEIRDEEANFYDSHKSRYVYDYLIESENNGIVEFRAPEEVGPYRLFVFLDDGMGNFASHNVPFYVVKYQ